MRNLRGGANVLNPRRGKLLEDLKQRSFMFSQSHKPDAREVGKRMREEWVSVLSPNGLAQEVQIWSELDRFRAPTTSRGQATVRRHAQRGAVPAAQRNSRSTELCGNQPVEWTRPAKLQTSLSRSNRSRFG
jgi:hypothetical protein